MTENKKVTAEKSFGLTSRLLSRFLILTSKRDVPRMTFEQHLNLQFPERELGIRNSFNLLNAKKSRNSIFDSPKIPVLRSSNVDNHARLYQISIFKYNANFQVII